MKKLLTLLFTGIMTLSLAACSSVDTEKFMESYNAAETAFNETGDYINENVELIAQELVDTMNQVGEKLKEHYKTIMENEDVTQEQVDTSIEWLDSIPGKMNEVKDSLETEINTFAEENDALAEEIQAKYDEALPLYNEAIAIATANGWISEGGEVYDETLTNDIESINTVLDSALMAIDDPTSVNAQAVLDNLNIMIDNMPAFVESINIPYNSDSEK